MFELFVVISTELHRRQTSLSLPDRGVAFFSRNELHMQQR